MLYIAFRTIITSISHQLKFMTCNRRHIWGTSTTYNIPNSCPPYTWMSLLITGMYGIMLTYLHIFYIQRTFCGSVFIYVWNISKTIKYQGHSILGTLQLTLVILKRVTLHSSSLMRAIISGAKLRLTHVCPDKQIIPHTGAISKDVALCDSMRDRSLGSFGILWLCEWLHCNWCPLGDFLFTGRYLNTDLL